MEDPQPVDMPLQSGTKLVDTLVENECFYQQFHLFIISTYLNVVNYPTPKAMLFVVKERLECPKYNIGLGGVDRYVHCSKRDHFIKVSQHFWDGWKRYETILHSQLNSIFTAK